MPSQPIRPARQEKQEHIEQARHNEAFLAHLQTTFPDEYHDWKVTACFYTALHWVRMFLAARGIIGRSHQDTLDCLNPKPANKPAIHIPLPTLFDAYLSLKLLSENARYKGFLNRGTFNQLQAVNLAKARQALAVVKDELYAQGMKQVDPHRAEIEAAR